MRIYPITCAVCGKQGLKTLHDLPAPITRNVCIKCGRETTHFVAFGEPQKPTQVEPPRLRLD